MRGVDCRARVPLDQPRECCILPGMVKAICSGSALQTQILYEFFGVAQSTGQNKSKEIRDALLMGPMSPEWTLPSRLADNPLVWMLQVDGLMIDIRQAPVELQRLAYEKGLNSSTHCQGFSGSGA